jgi:hypothetical protein
MIPNGLRRHRDLLIERLLEKWDCPMTMPEMSAASGLTAATVWRYVKRLTAEHLGPLPRQAHISAWKRDDGPSRKPVAVYSRGPGKDVPCTIKPIGNTKSYKEYRKRQRASGDWEDRKAKERAKHWANKPARPDPITSALFGGTNANR